MSTKFITEEQAEQLKTIFGGSMSIKLSQVLKGNPLSPTVIKNALDTAMANKWVKKAGDQYLLMVDLDNVEFLETARESYIDHNGIARRIIDLYSSQGLQPILIVGPAGCGKTQMVLTVAREMEKKGMTKGILTLNGSDDTKTRDLVGMLRVKPDGTFQHHPAGVAQAMQEGKLFYFDEANTVPPGILVKLDQGMDNRKELTFTLGDEKCTTITAQEGFTVIATVNPLSMVGTRSMPSQMMSRFTYVFYMDYPQTPESEMEIVMANTKALDKRDELWQCVKAIQSLRSESHELPYRPTVRESIACHRCLLSGINVSDSMEIAVLNRGYHWSPEVAKAMYNIAKLHLRK